MPAALVAGRSVKSGMMTTAATSGRSRHIRPILRARPRSLASIAARTTALTIIASVSCEDMGYLLLVLRGVLPGSDRPLPWRVAGG
jgi:hypothetical protein